MGFNGKCLFLFFIHQIFLIKTEMFIPRSLSVFIQILWGPCSLLERHTLTALLKDILVSFPNKLSLRIRFSNPAFQSMNVH